MMCYSTPGMDICFFGSLSWSWDYDLFVEVSDLAIFIALNPSCECKLVEAQVFEKEGVGWPQEEKMREMGKRME